MNRTLVERHAILSCGFRAWWPVLVACVAAVLVAACGGGPSSPSPTGATIVVSASGVTPTEVVVALGSSVTFQNNDVRPHGMSSDPVQTHTDCPAINDVGTLAPGQSRSTSPLNVARVCGFHDHNNENDPAYKGRIIVR